jgi:hypothetical protein
MKRLLFLFFICLGFSACDPAFTFNIRHTKKPGNAITVYFKKGGFMAFQLPQVLEISNDDTCCKKDFFCLFGLGNWDTEKLTAFSKTIDSIHILHRDQYFTIKDQDKLYSYLLLHRKGMMKQRIVIKLK